ncbi:MAG: Rieske 2Fe-2S domain-containing protein [Hyphomicrobiales bacterium]|nr:Rieske 2Fe-2S domain-containing protein [Hyphomicrobiales bacterium]
MSTVNLCAVNDLADPGSAGFSLDLNHEPVSVMVIRYGGTIRVYLNSCPHVGVPLDLAQGRFFDRSLQHIQCSYHGALFRIDDGVCIFGPCQGAALKQVPYELVNDDVVVKIDALEALTP